MTTAHHHRRRPILAVTFALGASLWFPGTPLSGQTEPEPIMESLRDAISHEGLTLGMLLQAVVDPALDGSDPDPASVQVAAMRVLLSGSLDHGFSYFFQTNLAAAPAILDARFGWSPSEQLTISAGRFKTPFSRELLTFAGAIDFVNRARVVDELAPNRQMGVQVGGRAGSTASWSLGGFTGPDNSPANESLLGVARFEVTPTLNRDDAALSIAASAAVGRDGAVAGRAIGAGFDGDGSIYGLDARFTEGRLLLAGEAAVADFDPTTAASVDAAGLYLTAGWMTTEKSQVLVRWDRLRAVSSSTDDVMVLGYNLWPTSASEIQVNWVVPVAGSAAPHKLLVNLQVGF